MQDYNWTDLLETNFSVGLSSQVLVNERIDYTQPGPTVAWQGEVDVQLGTPTVDAGRVALEVVAYGSAEWSITIARAPGWW